ncbi:MAG: hypothetical protein DRR08_13980 [Candidatus Parabeggiatoa sp. nov. 2]|nr:MAG: hypothetical protein B6247_08080 [Beggiatoa sp. 4572_84]RKZ59410.1 MAG: hypothetical protein DRR08_13980 [Gammaproteobacteria bacterium]
MPQNKRFFETRGPVDPSRNYVVSRQTEIAELVERIKQGRYIVIFAPRQTGKTTFFRWALSALEIEDNTYFPIKLDFQMYKSLSNSAFYHYFYQEICNGIQSYFQKHQLVPEDTLSQFLEKASITDHVSMVGFFVQLSDYLKNQKLVLIIDEFDGIPTAVVSDFLYSLRYIYLSDMSQRCPYSVGIVGVKNITQLNYDRSISPFNIQDDFALPNFAVSQVRELFEQYTQETGQVVAEDVIETLHKQTAGQPFLVNRLGQILTEEMNIPLPTTITHAHFDKALQQILEEANVHLDHLVTNIRKNPRFESLLMKITSYDAGIRFNIRDEAISELVTYGVLKKSHDSLCEIANPIYYYCIMQTFKPTINGLEQQYLPEEAETCFVDYLTDDDKINMRLLLANFNDFIARAGYRILQVPDTPQEFIGQYLLFGYLDTFVLQIQGFMYLEVRSGRGRMDLIILHQQSKYIVETKIWEGNKRYQAGKRQLAKYLKLEGISDGYYVVFDHRQKPEARLEEEMIDGLLIISYVIPVVQEKPSNQ